MVILRNVVVLFLVGVFVSAAAAEVVYQNDFGTEEQFNEWMSSGYLERNEGGIDLDGDGEASTIRSFKPSDTTMLIEITAPFGSAYQYPVVTGRGYGSIIHHGTTTRLSVSLDGICWDEVSIYPPDLNGWYTMTSDTTGNLDYASVESFWVRIHFESFATGGVSLPQAKEIEVNATVVAGPAHSCGEAGTEYIDGDISGSSGVPDCYVDMYDVAKLSEQWLECNDPVDVSCP
jgi:hypothetical protein